MPNKDKLAQEQQFADWLDGKSEDYLTDSHSDTDTESKLWQQRIHSAQSVKHHVNMASEHRVPHWDREATFQGEGRSLWQWQGLPALSMAFSVFAMALVLFKVELVMQDGGILLSFSGSQEKSQDARLADLVDQKLQMFAQEQQVVLANYTADIKVKQQESNLQLASYVIGASRQERQEDIGDFIQFINEQRKDELLDQKIKYQQLEQAIKFNKTYQRDDINKYGMKPGDVKTNTTNFNSEE
jgi:hypothetical protein